MKIQSLKEIYKIVEWRNHCVYKTKHLGFAWLTVDSKPVNDGNLQFTSVSTELSKKLGHNTVRTVPNTELDMVITTLTELGVK